MIVDTGCALVNYQAIRNLELVIYLVNTVHLLYEVMSPARASLCKQTKSSILHAAGSSLFHLLLHSQQVERRKFNKYLMQLKFILADHKIS